MRALVVVAGILFATQAAQASVIYNWVPASGAGNASGTLVLTDAAYASGHVDWESQTFGSDPILTPIVGPVSSLSFNYFGGFGGSSTFQGNFRFHLTTIGDGLLGNLYANNTGSELSMGGTAPLWTVERFVTDGYPCNHSSDNCGGDTGRWLLASAPQQNVPEPASALLLISAIGGLSLLRRRSRR